MDQSLRRLVSRRWTHKGWLLNMCAVVGSSLRMNSGSSSFHSGLLSFFFRPNCHKICKGSREPLSFYFCVQTQIVLQTVRAVSTVVHFKDSSIDSVVFAHRVRKIQSILWEEVEFLGLFYIIFFFISFFQFFNS